MVSELENASLKLVLDLEEARAAVDEIEKEQERRRGSQRPGYAAPEETPVVRPDAGVSAATGEKEPPVPAPSGDAIPPDMPGEDDAARGAGSIDWKATIARGKQAAGFAAAPSMDAAAHLGAELSREVGSAAAGRFAAAGPAGLVLAAVLAATPTMVSRGPAAFGFGRGAGGGVGEAIVRGTFGIFGSDSFRDFYNRKSAQLEALLDTYGDLGDVAYAQQRTMGGIDTRAINARFGSSVYTYHTQVLLEAKRRSDMEADARGAAFGRLVTDSLSDFLKGNK